MFTERWKSLFGGGNGSGQSIPSTALGSQSPVQAPTKRKVDNAASYSRNSAGLEQFFYALRDTSGLSILDLSAASQANISYITNLGHRIYAEDLIDCLDNTFPADDFFAAQTDPNKGQAVLDQCLNFPEGHFDGALAWDALQYVAPPLLQATVDRIYEVLRPNAYLLAFFSAQERAPLVNNHLYRITDGKTLQLTPRTERPPAQHFNSRNLERLFSRFQQVKFFLTRDSLREVLVKR